MHRRRSPHEPLSRAGRLAHRLVAPAAIVALLWRSTGAGAAPYAAGSEPDPPTGVTHRIEAPQTVPADTGIQWALAPLRYGGTVSLEGRWIRLEDGNHSSQGLVFNDIDFATHVWQPWFIQLRAGVGALAARDSSGGADAPTTSHTSAALTGRFSMLVFPASRFPFELRAEVSDSRVRGDSLGTDYRSHRVSLSQSYRPETGNDNYNLNLEYSRLRANNGGEDTVKSLHGTALRQFAEHSFELTAQVSVNDRSNSDDSNRVTTLNARHTFNPQSSLHVDTLATWNDVQLHSGGAGTRFDSSTDIRQISSFATWRPSEGDWLHSPSSPLYLTGSVRVVDAGSESGATAQRFRAFNASLGATQELTREWRLAGSLSATQLAPDSGARSTSAIGNGSVNYTPQGLTLGDWRYTPSVGANASVSRGSEAGQRYTLGGQFAHGVSRSLALGETDSLAFNLTQSLAALRDSQTQTWTRALAHSAGLFWQGSGDGTSQSYASLSGSDSRSWAQESGSFQLVNMQVSRRTQLSRHASWSGNLTFQTSRSDTTQIDAFSGLRRQASPGWQRFYSGSLSYENQRVLGVPRLRYTAQLTVNSQQLESRAEGDIDAPRERITESLENRLDYAIGRLDTRLTARLARVDGRSVASIFARVQRRY